MKTITVTQSMAALVKNDGKNTHQHMKNTCVNFPERVSYHKVNISEAVLLAL